MAPKSGPKLPWISPERVAVARQVLLCAWCRVAVDLHAPRGQLRYNDGDWYHSGCWEARKDTEGLRRRAGRTAEAQLLQRLVHLQSLAELRRAPSLDLVACAARAAA